MRTFGYSQINAFKICLTHRYGNEKMHNSYFNFKSYVIKDEYLEICFVCVCVLNSFIKIFHLKSISVLQNKLCSGKTVSVDIVSKHEKFSLKRPLKLQSKACSPLNTYLFLKSVNYHLI